MSDVPSKIEVPSTVEDVSVLTQITDIAETVVTGIPAPIRKTLFKAVHQLCMAAVDTQVAKLEGHAAETRAATKNRIKTLDATGDQIAKRLDVSPEYVDAAVEKASERIVRQRINVDSAVRVAVEELQKEPTLKIGHNAVPENRIEITEDWLNAFEQEAVNMSSEHMQKLFGKILAGEIRRPTSFSIRTIKLMAQLDNRPAELFRKLCSLASTMRLGSYITDSRVITVGEAASTNGLQAYGLGFAELNILFEYGLIISDYNSYMMYMGAIANNGTVRLPFIYMNEHLGLIPKAPMTPEQTAALRVNGVMLSRAGMELLDIVEVEEDSNYTTALRAYFDRIGFTVATVDMSNAVKRDANGEETQT